MVRENYDDVDGVVFDFGGVITVSPVPGWDRTLYPYCEALGVSRQAVLDGFRKYRALWDGDAITFSEMYARVFADCGLRPPSPDVVAEIYRLDAASWVATLRPDTLALMRELKARGKRIGVLSNMATQFYRELYVTRCADYRACVDVEVISGLERLCKPDPAIYRLAAERMGIAPARLLFYDDLAENVEGARALGWQAEVYPPLG